MNFLDCFGVWNSLSPTGYKWNITHNKFSNGPCVCLQPPIFSHDVTTSAGEAHEKSL